MILDIQVNKFQKAKVWLNEFPETSFKADDILSKSIQTFGHGKPAYSSVVAEWEVPQGPMSSYGLLGAEFRLQEHSSFEIEVHTAGSDGVSYKQSLVSQSSEDARVGLPKEFASSIFRGVIKSHEKTSLSPSNSKMSFKYGVYGKVGSSEIVFENLARIVYELMFSKKSFSEEELKSLFHF